MTASRLAPMAGAVPWKPDLRGGDINPRVVQAWLTVAVAADATAAHGASIVLLP